MAVTRYIDTSYGIPGFNKPTKQTVETVSGIQEVDPQAKYYSDIANVSDVPRSGRTSSMMPSSTVKNTNRQSPVSPAYSYGSNVTPPPTLSSMFQGQNLSVLFPFLASMLGGFGGGNPPESAKPDPTATGGGFDQYVGDLNKNIEDYANQLRGEAQGDYDFAIKWLTANHELALGKDDKARAEFFEKVADKLEEKIGRIPYDYFQKTDREKKDVMDFLKAQNMEEEDRIAREKEFQKQQDFAKGIEKQQTQQEFNTRGLLGSGIQQKQEAQQAEKRQLFETDPFYRRSALEGAQRGLQTQRGVLESQRRLQDIQTGARRGGTDAQNEFVYGQESQKRALDKKLAEILRTENSSKLQAYGLGQEASFGGY